MANVNSIQKTIGTTPTDFYFEDTAGRNIIATQQDTSLVAVKSYAIGDFFWYNNKLYKVKSAVSSGATIVLATDADEVTVGDELKAKVNDNPAFSQASTQANINSGESFSTILGKIKKFFSDLKALAFIDTATTDPTTKYLRGDGEWITFPQGGHNMIDNTDLINEMNTAIQDITDDEVVSAYGVGKWSNVDAINLVVQLSEGDDGVGTWEDEDTWESGSRTGWIVHSLLKDVLSDNSVEVNPVFIVPNGTSNAVSAYSMRVDDGITGSLGGVAIKLNAPIDVQTAYVGVQIKRYRVATVTVSPYTP